MLENLDKINWNNISTQGGPSKDLPELLRRLADANEYNWETLYEPIKTRIEYDGEPADVTPVVIPFLIEFLAAETAPVELKEEILGLFWNQAMNEYEKARDRATLGQGYKLSWDIQQAIISGTDVYISLLRHPTFYIREAASKILAIGHESYKASAIGRALWEYFQNETEDERPHWFLIRFSDFMAEQRERIPDEIVRYAEALQPLAESDREFPFPLAASIAVMSALGDQTPGKIVAVIQDFLTRPPNDDSLSSNMRGETLWRIKRLGDERFVALLENVLNAVERADLAREQVAYLLMLLPSRPERGFNERKTQTPTGKPFIEYRPRIGDPPEALSVETLTPLQRRAVRVVLNAHKVWEVPHNLLEMYGLPASRHEVRRLLAQYDD
jgi:hypothetical protein